MTGSPWAMRGNRLIEYVARHLGLDPEKDEQQMISAVQQYEHYYAAFQDEPIETTASTISAREATIVEAIIMLHRGTYRAEWLPQVRDAGGVDAPRRDRRGATVRASAADLRRSEQERRRNTMSEHSLAGALDGFERAAKALHAATDARTALRAEDDLAMAFARVVGNLCHNAGVAADFDDDTDGGVSNLEQRITMRLRQLRTERRQIAFDKQQAAAG